MVGTGTRTVTEFSSETSSATVLTPRTETSVWVALPAFPESIDC